jgi:hypothetical protein
LLIKDIHEDPKLELQLIATGMHLSPEFGLTYREIEKDGYCISKKIEIALSADTPTAVTKSTGLGMIGFADAFKDLKPDMVLVLGDRYEILAIRAAVLAARISYRSPNTRTMSGFRSLNASANPIMPSPVDLVTAVGVSAESAISIFLEIQYPSFSISL